MNENSGHWIGNLGEDPELRYTPAGHAVSSFRMAINFKLGDKEETTWLKINCWRTLAENVAESLVKGARVIVIGRLQERSWETEDGSKRSVLEVQADAVGPSLQWATAKVEKQARSES